MIHGLLLLCLINQFTVSVESPSPSFTVEVEKAEQPIKQIPLSPYYVIFFTASYCGPCHQYKDSGKFDELKEALAAEGIRVREVDFQKEPGFYYGAVPKFRLGKVDDSGQNVRVAEWPAGDLVTPQRVLNKINEQTKESPDVK